MIDRIFPAVLTFCLMAGGTVAFGSELLRFHPRVAGTTESAAIRVVQLQRVEVHAKRLAPTQALAQADSVALAVLHFQ